MHVRGEEMHIHLPKPLHGWRELVGEVGIIVIGVLIALGAEQLVEWRHWQHEAEETRAALRVELARAFGSFQFILARQDCADRRLDQLEAWLDESHEGDRPNFAGPIGVPSRYTILTGAWEVAKSGQAAWRMPLKERLRFAHLYGAIQAFSDEAELGHEAWQGLDGYGNAEPVNHDDRVRMRGLIAAARHSSAMVRIYPQFIVPDATLLKIEPEKRPGTNPAGDRAFCKPLIAARISAEKHSAT
jgi:hypothetical protein